MTTPSPAEDSPTTKSLSPSSAGRGSPDSAPPDPAPGADAPRSPGDETRTHFDPPGDAAETGALPTYPPNPPPPGPPPLAGGFGRYTILRKLGQGGMGTVY